MFTFWFIYYQSSGQRQYCKRKLITCITLHAPSLTRGLKAIFCFRLHVSIHFLFSTTLPLCYRVDNWGLLFEGHFIEYCNIFKGLRPSKTQSTMISEFYYKQFEWTLHQNPSVHHLSLSPLFENGGGGSVMVLWWHCFHHFYCSKLPLQNDVNIYFQTYQLHLNAGVQPWIQWIKSCILMILLITTHPPSSLYLLHTLHILQDSHHKAVVWREVFWPQFSSTP